MKPILARNYLLYPREGITLLLGVSRENGDIPDPGSYGK
jgi:hypothetical protein